MRFMLVAFAAVLGLSGCFAHVDAPVTGFLFTNTESPISATSGPRGSKHGTASSASILGLIAMGESSIQSAADRAKIKTISHVDAESYSLLGLYASYTVHVYGE